MEVLLCETPYEVQSQTPNSTRIALPTPKMFCLNFLKSDYPASEHNFDRTKIVPRS